MDAIREQMAVTTEISTAISGPITNDPIDEEALQSELDELEAQVLDDRVRGAERAPKHTPVTSISGKSILSPDPIIRAMAHSALY
jgi:charged multivesicular body protein 4